jgi:competence protein ComEC
MQEPARINTQPRSPFKGFLPFFWMALACVMGIISADFLQWPGLVWLLGLVLCLAAWALTLILPKSLIFTYRLKKWTWSDKRLPGVILLAIFFLGAWRYTASQPEINARHVAYYQDRGMVQLVGIVVQPVDYRDRQTNLTLELESLILHDESLMPFKPEEISGRVLVQVDPGADWAYGDRIRVAGELRKPTESADFSYGDYLARKGIYGLVPYAQVERLQSGLGNPIRSFLYRLREKSYATLHQSFPSPESDLLSGILLGRDQGLSKEVQEAFRRTGTTHIIAISGFNVAILAGIFSGVFTRLLGRKWGTLTALGAISSYTILVGGDAAVVRAAIMGSLGVFGGLFGRRQNGLNSLGLASLGMILINPNIPWDIGFQLSLAATSGLVLYAQPLEEKCIQWMTKWLPEESAQKVIGPLSEFFLFTLAAQLMTLPIVAYHFGGFSWVTLIANPLILPPQSLVMILGGSGLLLGLFLPGLGKVLAFLTLPFVRYTIRMVSWLGSWPGSDWTVPDFSALWLLFFYCVLFVLTLTSKEQQKYFAARMLSPQAGLLMVFSLVIFLWNLALTHPDEYLHMTLLDTAGTVLIQTPNGHAVLIGGGPSNAKLRQNLDEMLPSGDRSIDLLIVGSTTQDDLVALSSMVGYTPIERSLWGVEVEANTSTRALFGHFLEDNVPMIPLEVGQCVELGEGIILRTLWTSGKGALMWLEWKNFSALLPTGKIGGEWLAAPSPPDVLLLPDSIAPEDFSLARVNLWSPAVILLPLKEADMPLIGEHELLKMLADYPVVHTLDHDIVQISTDGENLWVSGR